MWCSSNLLYRFPHGDGPSGPAPAFSEVTLYCLPLSVPLACHCQWPFSLANFMFSLSFSLPLQLFLTLSSAAVLSLKEKTAIVEELVRAPYCLKQETNQSPSPTTAHIYTTLNKCTCVPVSRQEALLWLTWCFTWNCLVLNSQGRKRIIRAGNGPNVTSEKQQQDHSPRC